MIDESLVPALWGFVVSNERSGQGDGMPPAELQETIRRLEQRVANLERALGSEAREERP